jgi:hypothetical protein
MLQELLDLIQQTAINKLEEDQAPDLYGSLHFSALHATGN